MLPPAIPTVVTLCPLRDCHMCMSHPGGFSVLTLCVSPLSALPSPFPSLPLPHRCLPSAQITARPGRHRRRDLVPGGALYEEAAARIRSRAAAGTGAAAAAAAAENVIGRTAGGVTLRGVDVPRSMRPGRLRVMVRGVRLWCNARRA